MLKYLEAYCDINELEPMADYLAIGQRIESQSHKNLVTRHIHGYVFHYFNQLLQDKISLEDFMQIGDIYSEINTYDYQSKNPASLQSMQEIVTLLQDGKIDNSLVIVDTISLTHYKEFGEIPYTELLTLLKKYNSDLVTL